MCRLDNQIDPASLSNWEEDRVAFCQKVRGDKVFPCRPKVVGLY
jgi:hypothetical protein